MENSHVLGNFGKFQKPLSRAKIHFWKENLQPNFCHGKKIYCPEKSLGKNLIEKNQAESFSENFHNHVFAPKKKVAKILKIFPVPSTSIISIPTLISMMRRMLNPRYENGWLYEHYVTQAPDFFDHLGQ